MTNNVNEKNVYGYLIEYYEMLKFLEKNNFEGDIWKEIWSELNFIRNEIQKIYNHIIEDEKYFLFK